MKKTLVSALTTALVIGAASTTFAAAQNPFQDVPADHWAYDAVAQLAKDGVVTGYGDGTYNGQKQITRYEMAVMVARAMANNNGVTVSGNDKALLDKLAAEFGDELNNLGVRVANLEKNADKVAWHGTAEYTFQHYMTEGQAIDEKDSRNNVLFRLEPSAEVNNHWHVKARLDADTDLDTDKANDADHDKVSLKRVWAEGNYGSMTYKFGKFAAPDDDTITDTPFSGVEVGYNPAGDGVNFIAGAGRVSNPAALNHEVVWNAFTNGYDYYSDDAKDSAANYQYVGLGLDKGKLTGAVRWHHLNSAGFNAGAKNAYSNSKTDEANIILAKGAYRFSKNVAFKGFYAQNHDADYYNKAGSAELDYKGAQAENKGTYGAWVAYRHLGRNAFVASPWDVINIDKHGQKGFEVGGNYAMFKNTILTLRYGKGKDLQSDKDVQNLFGRVNFLF